MKIPKDERERDDLYQELISRCEVSRANRTESYRMRRQWYLQGTDGDGQARFNKLRAHIDTLMSYLYAQETTKFALELPLPEEDVWDAAAEVARDRFQEVWHASDADLKFGLGLEWALVYDTMLTKALPSEAGPVLYLVQPSDFGILREDVPVLEDQEAVCEWYSLSLPELSRLLAYHQHRGALMAAAVRGAVPGRIEADTPTLPPAMQRVVLSQVTPNLVGVASVAPRGPEEPMVEEPTAQMVELTVWDDDLDDYRVITYAVDLGVMIWDRKNPYLPQDLAYTALTPHPDPRYFWGHSELEPLIPLQRWREDRFTQIDELLRRQLKPPRALLGIPGITEERAQALNRAGGILFNPGAVQGKIETYIPQMPADAFQEISQIDAMFGEAGGLPPILQGQADPAVRATGQAGVMGSIASGRTRRRALIVEDMLEATASKMWRLLQRLDGGKYRAGEREFLLSQLPEHTTVRVSAHSSSALYGEQMAAKAKLLLESGAIDKVDFVELVNPPNVTVLKRKAKKLQEAQAQRAREIMDIQRAKAERTGRR